MLGVGEPAPDFSISFPDGSTRTLVSLRGRPVILFFFPKANTSGCTRETRGFAERYEHLRNAGFEVIGVSVDTPKTQAAFAERCGSRFPMVGDPSKAVARAYGVLGMLGVAKRVTFLVDRNGTIRDMVEGLMPGPHLAVAERWAEESSPKAPTGT